MKQVRYSEFCDEIAKDHNIDIKVKHKVYYWEFPIKNGKKKINFVFDGTIVDREGNEFPYMLSMAPAVRNSKKLEDFDHLYVMVNKSLKEILEEAKITLESKKCQISEGGGWYSEGKQYFYKDIYCEV